MLRSSCLRFCPSVARKAALGGPPAGKLESLLAFQDTRRQHRPIVNGTGANERVGKMFPLNLGDEPLLGGSTRIRPSEADSSGGFHSSNETIEADWSANRNRELAPICLPTRLP
ncbi:hypothetical protein HZH68_008933 [Vespula germanica]|uniref:Uncharacterized protein n=1 Tax=Vespula germanica TaxID=30212 RepID=A0A834K5K5_VESGE|nr:hypothetical protein HZH68_008933 [Vespula germanica]